MKRLLIMRHAKTEASEIFRSDFVRNLTINGIEQAAKQGHFLSLLPFEPQLLLVSPSNRTLQTLEHVLPETHWENAEIKVQDNLYHSGLTNLLKTINLCSDEIENLMLIGHNFGVLELVQHFSKEYIEKFSTGTMVLFEFDTKKWADTAVENAKIVYLKTPLDN